MLPKCKSPIMALWKNEYIGRGDGAKCALLSKWKIDNMQMYCMAYILILRLILLVSASTYIWPKTPNMEADEQMPKLIKLSD